VSAVDPYRREYRYSGGSWLWLGLAPVLLAGVGLIVRMALDDEVPIVVPAAVGAALAALFLFVLRLVMVTATISDATRLTARGAFRSRATAWPDVQGIEIEVNPGAGAQGAPSRIVVLYDASGRRRILPHLNDRNIPDLAREVAALREAWMLRRGDDWAPVPEAADKIARMRRHPTPLVHIAVQTMLGAFLLGGVLFIVALAMGVYDGSGTNAFADVVFHPLALSMVLPLGVYIGTLVVGAILRRR
jgi:preprotein translocase subunit Sss1